jgi:hypothetical protein
MCNVTVETKDKPSFYDAKTALRMYFKGEKYISELVEGDILMSDRFKPLIVESIVTKKHTLFTIDVHGEDKLSMTADSTIHTYNTSTQNYKSIKLCEYMNLQPYHRDKYLFCATAIQYRKRETKNDPYLIGLLLGSNQQNAEVLLRDYFLSRIETLSQKLNKKSDKKVKEHYQVMDVDKDELMLIISNDYQLPDEYCYNEAVVRLAFLKGFFYAKRHPTSKRSRSADRKGVSNSLSQSRILRNSARNRTHSSIRSKSQSKSSGVRHTHTASQSEIELSDSESDEKVNTRKPRSMYISKKSGIPVMKKREINIEVTDKIIGEQVKNIIKSLGHRCIYLERELTIYTDTNTLLEEPNFEKCQRTCQFRVISETAQPTNSYSICISGNDTNNAKKIVCMNGLVILL